MKKLLILFLIILSGFFMFGCRGAKGKEGLPQPSHSPAPTHSPAPSQSPKPTQSHEPEIISEFSTDILDKHENRLHNIEIACKVLEATTVKPGEEFSFNQTIGQRTAERGYLKAAILLDEDEKGYEYGGGICQVSTTMYNSVKRAGMEILERHNHQGEVGYIKIGEDAAVNWGSEDFRFKNTKDFEITFKAFISEDMKLHINVLKMHNS